LAAPITPQMRAALRHLRRADPRFAALMRTHGAPPLRRTRNSFRALAQSIISQQLSVKAAAVIYRRVCRLFTGSRFPSPQHMLQMPHVRLRAAGLSNNKAAFLHELARAFQSGRVKPRTLNQMADTEIAAQLVQLRGIGQWTVDMYLLFDLCRPNVLPVGDLGVRKGMQRWFGLRQLPEPERMRKLAAPWQPYCSAAAWYMWRVLQST
jgi:DNA-3-methyladenine glycosylase II